MSGVGSNSYTGDCVDDALLTARAATVGASAGGSDGAGVVDPVDESICIRVTRLKGGLNGIVGVAYAREGLLPVTY